MLWHNQSRDGFYMFTLPRFSLMVSLRGSFSATAFSESRIIARMVIIRATTGMVVLKLIGFQGETWWGTHL